MDNDLISRSELRNAIETIKGSTNFVALTDVRYIIDNAPTVEQPQSEWITTRTMFHDGDTYCSICDEENIIRTKFCPNCGARMSNSV